MQIILREFGGLGNQFFRYAALRYLAKLHSAHMRISVDPEWNAVSFGHPRPCLLQHYAIPAVMQERTLTERLMFTEKPWLQNAIAPFAAMLGARLLSQCPADRYVYVPGVSSRPGLRRLYALGYWHTYKLVNEVAPELRSELRLKELATGENLKMLERIGAAQNSVSLHIRRGDCKIPATLRTDLPFDYYGNAIQLMQDTFGRPTFFVFSDDVAFARTYLPQHVEAVYVDHNDDFTAHEDMRLMSSCQHHIIANSTFSWWGAWLGQHPGKLVLAPKHWDCVAESYYPDLLPPEWMLLDVVSEEVLCQ